MKIVDMFQKTLSRDIKGVIVADELDNQIAFQELDEYVVTKELSKHFRSLVSAYLAGLDNPSDIAARSNMAVWISGFFGSGKSHFLKILSYLLGNRKVTLPETDEEIQAISFFESKIGDGMMLADLKRMIGIDADVILFNIDAKADSGEGNDALLNVFLRVFNEMRGFNGDYPHVADLEHHLQEKGVFETFKKEFTNSSGLDWLESRDAYSFHEDHIVKAMIVALEMSESAARNKFDHLNSPYKINIEGFAKKINAYLGTRPKNHRIIFLVDEVGQFIGKNGKLMLNLQTITEELGSICNGQAWVIVTSQEDIDAVLGDVKEIKDHDFSKIQGRFKTRLSLSSSNTDEVIQLRLLEKTDAAKQTIGQLFDEEVELIKNQIRFESSGPTLKGISDRSEFISVYPFVSYQFKLVQDVFESVRRAGATGLHLSRGERSMLNAFQDAAQINQNRELGALVPFKDFYPSIESFLDTAVKKTIDQASGIPVLEAIDHDLIRVLFLIRYTDERITGTVDNLVTLLIDNIATDRVVLKQNIEAGLKRLEKENLIARNGEIWYFLTNEEQDVSREIKKEDISGSETAKILSEWIFEDLLKGKSKYRYAINKRDYPFNRLCDHHPRERKQDNDLTVEIITPLFSDFNMYNEAKCILRSSESGGRLVIKLPDNPDLGRSVRSYLQTGKYIYKKSDSSAPQTLQRILRERTEQNQQAKARIISLLEVMFLEAEFYALNKSLPDVNRSSASGTLDSCIVYLIENIYTKLPYIQETQADPLKEIRAVLLSNDVAQQKLLDKPEHNPRAIKEIREYLKLKMLTGRVILKEVVEHFNSNTFGWPDWEIVLTIARLYKAEELHLVSSGALLNSRQAADLLLKTRSWSQVALDKRKKTDDQALKEARDIGQQLFGKIGPDGEEALSQFLIENIEFWRNDLLKFQGTAESGKFPGLSDIKSSLQLIEKQLHHKDKPFNFIAEFVARKNDLLELEEDFRDLKDFHTGQIHTWRNLLKAINDFKPNRTLLIRHEDAKKALSRLSEISEMTRPYGSIHEVPELISTVKKINESELSRIKTAAITNIKNIQDACKKEFDKKGGGEEFNSKFSGRFVKLLEDIAQETSIPQIVFILDNSIPEIESYFDEILEELSGKSQTDSDKPKVMPKQTLYLKAGAVWKKGPIETVEDIDEYLNDLRSELESAIQKNKRVRIQ